MPGEPTFSELLREQRRAAGLSQEDLAERASLSVGAIRSLEQGSRLAPHRDTVAALTDALDLADAARLQFEDAAARARGRHPRGDSGLPVPLTSFVERNEVNELEALLAEHRLLTVTGSGGVGKTRIAIEVVRRAEPQFDEVWFVDLLPIRDGSLIAAHVAGRLNVSLEGEDGLSAVTRRLASRRTLLAIDNCEHVVGDAAVLVGSLLRSCPALTILTTSREPLAVSGELTYRLPSLGVTSAIDLFIARAQTTDRAFSAGEKTTDTIAEICRELECIPLAIELAASRVSLLGLEQLRKRLKGGMTLTGNRDVPLRHQTMEATIAWSYDLLTEADRVLFQRLSVFFGSFTLEAAENICAYDSLEYAMVADGLIRLAQKSLINIESGASSTRYRLLDSIRTFAWQRLFEEGQLEATMLRLIEWFASKSAPLESDSPAALFSELRWELDNIAAAMNWALSAGFEAAIASAARLLIGAWRVWPGMSRQLEVRSYGFGLLDSLKDDEQGEIVGLLTYSMAAFLTPVETVELSRRALPLLVATGHSDKAAALHSRCALVEFQRGDAAAAEEHLARGQALLNSDEERNTRGGITFATHGAYGRMLLKDFAGARALLDAVDVPPGDPFEADVGVVLASIEEAEGHVDKAIEILKTAKLGLSSSPIARDRTIVVSGSLARYYLRVGDAVAGEQELREALGAIVELRPPSAATTVAELAQYAAYFAATSGRGELAARLLGACEQRTNPATLDDRSTSRNMAIRALQDCLSPERADHLRRCGASEDVFAVLEEFLDQPAAADNIRPSATSSSRASSVTRSSPN